MDVPNSIFFSSDLKRYRISKLFDRFKIKKTDGTGFVKHLLSECRTNKIMRMNG